MHQHTQKKFRYSFLISALWLLTTLAGFGQCVLLPVPLEQRLSSATLIIEGQVERQFTIRPNDRGAIYTVHIIAPTKHFKGTVESGLARFQHAFTAIDSTARIALLTMGGQYGETMLKVTPELALQIGDRGLFLLKSAPTHLSAAIREEISLKRFSPVRSLSGILSANHGTADLFADIENTPLSAGYVTTESMLSFLKYDPSLPVATDPFALYDDVSALHRSIEQSAGQPLHILAHHNALQNITSFDKSSSLTQTATITSLAPTTISAGTQSLLTIRGTNFGTQTGQASVQFQSADATSLTYNVVPNAAILSWSPTQITVQVPSNAGTGFVRVVLTNGAIITSSQALTVNYNLLNNANAQGLGVRTNLVNRNGAGGYTITPNQSFQLNTPAYFAFIRALSAWRCNSGVNFRVSTNSSLASNTINDGDNVVSFVNTFTNTGAGSSALGQTYSYYGSCVVNNISNVFLTEFDIEFITTPPQNNTWEFGSAPSNNQFNFFSVALHELGHAHQLGHILNPSSLMFPNMSSAAVLSIDAGPRSGALEVISSSIFFNQCSQTNMRQVLSSDCDLSALQQVPAVPVTVSPTDSAVGQPTNALLRWNASVGALTYDVQLDTTTQFTRPISSQTLITATSVQFFSLLTNRRYFWRVRAVNTVGASAWVVRSFTTLGPQPPAAPILDLPLDGAVGQVLSPGFSWAVVSNADSYEIQIADNPNFTPLFAGQSGITATSFNVSGLQASTQYYWRVRAINQIGISGWSQRVFTTQGPPAPNPPILLSPADNATGTPLTVVTSWLPVQGASAYNIQIARSSDFGFLEVDQFISGTTSFLVSDLQPNITYFWRVRASNDMGMGQWSGARRFTTQAPQPPDAPILSFPEDGSPRENINLTLTWVAANGALGYDIQVSTSANFTTAATIYDLRNFNPPSPNDVRALPISGLRYSTNYFWRVRSVNANGSSQWVQRSFTTMAQPPPEIPTLISPPNEAINQAFIGLNLRWSVGAGAERYDVDVSPSSGFVPLTFAQRGVSSTTARITTNLLPNTIYFWRVRSVSTSGISPWVQSTFSTVSADNGGGGGGGTGGGNGQFNILTPVQQSTIPTTTIATWTSTVDATFYRVELSTSPTFTPNAFRYVTPRSFVIMEGLAEGTTYYMRLQSGDPTNTSDWSATRIFHTLLIPPQVPFNLLPFDNAANQILLTPLQWTTSRNADLIHIQLGTLTTPLGSIANILTIDPASLVINDSNLRFSPRITQRLQELRGHYWRARARRNGAWSEWSPVQTFYTGQVTSLSVRPSFTNTDFVSSLVAMPNPAYQSTIIRWQQEKAAPVRLELTTLTGQTIFSESLPMTNPGTHERTLDIASYASGSYLLRIHCGTNIASMPLMILR
jgi:hypothetical protein